MARFLKPSVNWLFAFLPIALILEHRHAPAPAVFFAAALAIVPLAHLIVEGTEHLAAHTGPAIGGLLNATFGNLPELIIGAVAIRAGLYEMVRASLVGALLANLLLGLGLAFLLGGLRHHEQEYSVTAARTYGSLMVLAVISMAVPAGFHQFTATQTPGVEAPGIDLVIAAILLTTYALYLVFMLRTHPDLFTAVNPDKVEPGSEEHWSVARALGVLVVASFGAAWMSEILVGAAEATGQAIGLSSMFIGLFILAVVGGAAEIFSAVATALKNKPDLAVGIAFGSCVQIALMVAPALVLLSYVLRPEPFTLAFSPREVLVLFLSVITGIVIASDGRANWYKGVQLLAVYLLFGTAAYLRP